MFVGFGIPQPISVVTSRYFGMFRCLPFICKLEVGESPFFLLNSLFWTVYKQNTVVVRTSLYIAFSFNFSAYKRQ